MLHRLARRFIAGTTMERVLLLVREDNLLNVYGIVNVLGEHYTRQEQVEKAVEEYKRLALEIKKRGLDAEISVKPTQLGLMISPEKCIESLSSVLHAGVFVWIDMESSEYTDQTLALFTELSQQYPNLGITLQAYLKRTEDDLRSLLLHKATVRLVKGAYRERPELLVDDVKENYKKLMTMLFENGRRFAIATHNDHLLQYAIRLSEEHEREPEFQLLLGVKEGLQARLAAEGYRVGEYIPYGHHWFPYFKRRVRENKMNALLAVKDFFTYQHRRLAKI